MRARCASFAANPASQRDGGPGKALDQDALDGAQPIGATEITFDIGDKAAEGATLYARRYYSKTGLNLHFGTPLGYLRNYALILLHYFRHSIATVERREASVPRYGTQGASQAPGVSRHKRVHARL